ncbi:MAG: hypothetical protein NT014_06505 [Candidatus Omnitrophica bacterium]|nr:hypothetical protein [Candidatus Omnitrophota bacterium]
MLEDYLTETELSQARTPEEFIKWFEQKLAITKDYREELKNQNILHKGIAKNFYEELFPLYHLLQRKQQEWQGVRITYIPRNQKKQRTKSFDVRLESSDESIPKHIEITQADRDEEEHLRMLYFLEQGSVSTTGKVTKIGTKKTGLQISVEDEVGESSKSIAEKIDLIQKAIDRKTKVTQRPDMTALLVYFDDYLKYPRGKGQNELDAFLSENESWKKQYMRLFIVSASGELFWEKS